MSPSPKPPITTSCCWNLTAQVACPPFWRLNTAPPVVSIIPLFYRFSKRCVSCLYHIVNLLGTISPVVELLLNLAPPTITMLSSCITTAAWSNLSLLKKELKWETRWLGLLDESVWPQGKKHEWMIWKVLSWISPQCVEVCPALLTMPPRDARSLGLGGDAATSNKLSSLVYDREGVVLSPLGGEWIKRLMIRRGEEVTFALKRRDRAVGLSWESFNACPSSISSGDNQCCMQWNSNNNGKLSLIQLEQCVHVQL